MAETPNARPSETRVQRLQRLRRAVESSGALHLKDAAELLKVSEMTVRRDLAGAEAALALLGGYVVNAASPTGISSQPRMILPAISLSSRLKANT